MSNTVAMATTRFNIKTWGQNAKYRENNGYEGCIYGTPTQMPVSIKAEQNLFVFEMNNDANIIMGIGLLKNRCKYEIKRIYSDMNYNRYIYKSPFRIDRYEIIEKYQSEIEEMENLLFKGKGHLKRGHGFTSINDKKKEQFNTNIGKTMYAFCEEIFSTKYNKNNQKIDDTV